jgi:flagellar biosynthesis/type III secretory pathway M-ring protein FliF/YscJ
MQPFSNISGTILMALRESKNSTRIALVVCLSILGISIVALVGSGEREMERLFAGRELSASEISKITQSFSVAKLDQWETVGQQIQIPRVERAKYLSALEGKFDLDTRNTDVDQVLQQTSILDTPSLRDLRLRNAKEKDLAMMVMQMPDIEVARVNIDTKQERGLSGQTKMVALAAIKAANGEDLTMQKAESIRDIIAARYAGLQRNEVVVIDLNSGQTFGSSTSPLQPTDRQRAMRDYERWWKNRVENLLVDIPNKRIEVSLQIISSNIFTDDSAVLDQSTDRVRASISVGIPHSYIQQVAKANSGDSITLNGTEYQKFVAQLETQILQSVTTLVQGVVPIVPQTMLDPLQVNVATIVDLVNSESVSSSSDPWMTSLTSHWREAVMGLVIVVTSLTFVRHLRNRSNISTPQPSPSNDIENLSTSEVILNGSTAAELESSIDRAARPEFANTNRPFQVYPLGVYDRRETQEASSVVRQAVAEVEAEPSLTNELDKLLSDSPADAADILRQWVSSTNDGS